MGWLVSGPVEITVNGGFTHTNLVISYLGDPGTCETQNDQIVTALQRFWEVETLGVEEQDNKLSKESFLRNLEFKNKHYSVSLPWIQDRHNLHNHYQSCLNRLRMLQKRLLNKSPEVLHEYQGVIEDQFKKGIVEEVTKQKSDCNSPAVHYMPHHPVIKRGRSTTKVRVVYDGSARFSESHLSLNDCLQTGPNLIPKLFDILIRFHGYHIALTADIEKAFLMIGIHESDRDMLRFI